MGARSFEDLVAWQLSRHLHSEVVEFTANGAAARDFHYRDQIRASSASAPANIAEGFARFRPREFARFLEFDGFRISRKPRKEPRRICCGIVSGQLSSLVNIEAICRREAPCSEVPQRLPG